MTVVAFAPRLARAQEEHRAAQVGEITALTQVHLVEVAEFNGHGLRDAIVEFERTSNVGGALVCARISSSLCSRATQMAMLAISLRAWHVGELTPLDAKRRLRRLGAPILIGEVEGGVLPRSARLTAAKLMRRSNELRERIQTAIGRVEAEIRAEAANVNS